MVLFMHDFHHFAQAVQDAFTINILQKVKLRETDVCDWVWFLYGDLHMSVLPQWACTGL